MTTERGGRPGPDKKFKAIDGGRPTRPEDITVEDIVSNPVPGLARSDKQRAAAVLEGVMARHPELSKALQNIVFSTLDHTDNRSKPDLHVVRDVEQTQKDDNV